MSHQTGIKAGEALQDVFRRCTTLDEFRLVKVSIVDEVLTCSGTYGMNSNDWREDYDAAVLPLLETDRPCYMLFRLKNKSEWVFIAYTPESAVVRDKMVYSGTRSTVKQEFGGGFIMDELIATDKKELTLAGYDAHKKAKDVPAPLTDREEELKLVKAEENSSEIHISTRHQTVQGLAFPLTEELVSAIREFQNKRLNYLQLCIDNEKEIIFLSTSGKYDVSQLKDVMPVDQAFYHLYRYSHLHQGENLDSLVFIYSMPGYKCPIKTRMLFSSCKGPLLEDLETEFEIKFDKRLEIQDERITEEFLNSEIHPPSVEVKEKFSKPKAPGRRAPTRRPK